MENLVKHRLVSYIKHLLIGQTKFEESAGLGRGFVSNIRGGISTTSLRKISERYPELNTDWLVTGNGEMLRVSAPIEEEEEEHHQTTVDWKILFFNQQIITKNLSITIKRLQIELEKERSRKCCARQ